MARARRRICAAPVSSRKNPCVAMWRTRGASTRFRAARVAARSDLSFRKESLNAARLFRRSGERRKVDRR
jgi:hypothetical protein